VQAWPSLQYCASICQTSVENNTVVIAGDGPLSFCTMYLLNILMFQRGVQPPSSLLHLV